MNMFFKVALHFIFFQALGTHKMILVMISFAGLILEDMGISVV